MKEERVRVRSVSPFDREESCALIFTPLGSFHFLHGVRLPIRMTGVRVESTVQSARISHPLGRLDQI